MSFYSQNIDRSNMQPTFRIKGKVFHVTAMKEYREVRSIAWHLVGMSGELCIPAT
jgi:hypothetical protein